jgi:serine protease AprX
MVLTTTLLGCGAGTSADDAASHATSTSAVVSGKKKIVNQPVVGQSECAALYASPQAQAALTQAVVDPRLQADGSVRTLILSFNEDAAVPAALSTLTGSLGLVVGQNLGALRELPMVALSVPVTPTLLATLRQQLQPIGLLSIYEDRPLHYFLDKSVAYIHADAARTAFQATGHGVGVGIIDSGIDSTQGDFPNVVKNVKVLANVLGTGVGGALYIDTPNSDLTSGHGTHVAGTVGGSGARSNGLHKGVAPGANLVAPPGRGGGADRASGRRCARVPHDRLLPGDPPTSDRCARLARARRPRAQPRGGGAGPASPRSRALGGDAPGDRCGPARRGRGRHRE